MTEDEVYEVPCLFSPQASIETEPLSEDQQELASFIDMSSESSEDEDDSSSSLSMRRASSSDSRGGTKVEGNCNH